ncbi:ABC-2 type transport system ATP-binding protein [Amycolatopsis echigonensis]|uniref:ABC-2 type transport system ATP-binding protein n=1 Tax=Amycolatopsis echigonensis TaxID=2576905 RepID=A0A2N3WJB1_9PSEU|nr:ABC transporter ATP-binding protein [Amycolatopsis niigatensis]PKV93948.1 ABC-2 type transport system ATP-binding protein [Amycolatopsis niigatensis]
MTTAPALRLTRLRKQFGSAVAVDDLDLVVPPGALFGLVGPNGAGKSTTLAMAVGLLRPDRGQSEVFGTDVWTDPITAKAMLGVAAEGFALPERLTGPELLTYLGRLRGLARQEVARRVEDLLTALGLDGSRDTLVADYSAGMRKKIALAAALLHTPRLLVLDEPFEAVDPVSAITIRALLRRFTAAGGSVIISSHGMALVEQICSDVGMIVDGRVVASGPLDVVRGGSSLEEAFLRETGSTTLADDELAWLVP